MAIELQDWLRGFVLIGYDGTEYRVCAVDDEGHLGAVVRGQEADETPHVLRVDEEGRIQMVAYGTTTVDGDVDVTQVAKDREVQGADGETLRTLAVDANGQLIMVPRGSTGNYMAVDSDGYLTTVLKGNYDGALRTVKVDDAGRMSALIIDSKDAWGRFLQIGNAELAVRLGSPVMRDRRGSVYMLESFETGMQGWQTATEGAGAAIQLTPDTCLHGGYSCKLTAGSDDERSAIIQRFMGALPITTIGLEMAFSLPGIIQSIELGGIIDDGVTHYSTIARFDDTQDDLDVWVDPGAWSKVDDVVLTYRWPESFNHLKLVADPQNARYLRVILNGTEWDITALTPKSSASGGTPYLGISVTLFSRAGLNDDAYVDDLVFTTAEPA